MTNELEVFTNEEFGEIRTITINGEPWFVGKDIATALGYSNTKDALAKHVDTCDKLMGSQNATPSILDSLGRKQNPIWINESGLYSLIFGSKLESANRFKHWVTSEVLPSIRKYGAYMTPEVIERTLTDPDYLIQLATALKEERHARKMAEKIIEEQKPLVDFANQVSDTTDLIDMKTMAKLLKDKK